MITHEVVGKVEVAVLFGFGSRVIPPGEIVPLSRNRRLFIDGPVPRVLGPKANEVGQKLDVGESVAGPWIIPLLWRQIYIHRVVSNT